MAFRPVSLLMTVSLLMASLGLAGFGWAKSSFVAHDQHLWNLLETSPPTFCNGIEVRTREPSLIRFPP